MHRTRSRALRALIACAAVCALATCEHETVAPRHPASLAVVAVLPAGLDLQAFNLTIDHVRLIAVNSQGDTAFDSLFVFPADSSSLSLSGAVPLAQSPETFQVTIQMLAGTVLLFSGTQTIDLTSGASNPPAQVPVTYSGPGQNVASLTLGPLDSVLTQGGTLQFRVTAKDSQNANVPSFYVSWSTSDTTVVKIDATGTLKAPPLRRAVNVRARTPNGVTASTPLTFVPALASVAFDSGCAQSALSGAQLPLPLVARVLGTDGLGVPGVGVQFSAVTAGGSVATPLAVSDTGGRARTLATLPTTPGPATFQASVTGLTPATCTQTGLGVATKLAFSVQPTTVSAGSSIAPPVVVEAQDAQGNLVPTFTGNVTVAIGTNPGGAVLSGSLTMAAIGGLATFANLSLDKVGTGYTLTAASAVLTGATSTAFNVTTVPATQLVFTTPPVNTAAGGAITPAVVVTAKDGLGNVVNAFTGSVTIAIANNPGGGVLSGTLIHNAVAGVATFNNLSINKAGTGYTLVATAAGVTSATSAAFNITAGALAQLAFTTQPANMIAGAVFASVVVTGQDLQGNTVTTFTGPVSLAFGSHPVGSTLTGTTSVAAVAGVATFGSLGRLTVAGGYTLVASAAGVGSRASNGFTVSPGAAAVLAFTVQPSTVLQGSNITPSVVVGVEDTLGNLVTTATDTVTLSIGTNPGEATLGGTTTKAATSGSGLATFTDLTVSIPASGYTLVASASGLGSATSAAFDVQVRPPGITWVNPAGGNWSTATNWSPQRVPGPKDTVSIVLPGVYVVTLDVNDTVAFLAVGGDTIGSIRMNVSTGRRLFIDSSAVILRAGLVVLAGSDTIGGPGNLTNQGSLSMTGSAITTAGFSNVFVLQVQGTSAITGLFSNSTGAVMFVQGGATSGDAILTSSSGFLNTGSIVLSNGDGSAAHNAVINVTSGSLTNLGVIQSAAVAVGNPPGGRTLHAQLDNQGTVIVQQTMTLDQAAAGHSNSGTIALSGGNLDVILSGFRPGFTNLAGGMIDVGPDTVQIVNQSTGAFLNDSGAALLGAGAIDIGTSSFISNGIVTVGETGPAFLAFTGPYTQGPPSELNVYLTSPATPGLTYSQFKVSDNVIIQSGATLTGAQLGNYAAGTYVIMTVPAGKTITGDFTTKNLPTNPLSGGQCTGSVVGGTQYVITCP